MKTGILGIVSVLLLSGTAINVSAEEKFREYRSTKGDAITAKLLHHKGNGEVTMELSTGKKATIPIDRFSADDQTFLKEWVKNTPAKLNYVFKYEVAIDRNTVSRNTAYYDRSKSGDHSYKVKITNASRDTVRDLTVKYQMFMQNNTTGSYTYTYGDQFMLMDDVPFPGELAFNHSREFKTKAFRIDEDRYRYYTSRNNRKDVMEGMIIRVFDKAGEVVDEHITQAAEKAGHQWIDDPNAKKATPSTIRTDTPGIRVE